MISFEEARDTILENVAPLEHEQVALRDSLGRVTAEDVIAPFDLPTFDNSAMDGFAVRAADCDGFPSLTIQGYIPAGGTVTVEATLGGAIKIMTGAPVPKGCDAVVPLEEAEEAGHEVSIKALVELGQHIRCAGEDVRQGETVLHAGTLIRVPEISILASLGLQYVNVTRRPHVAILSTGDELVELGQALPAYKVFDSNSAALAAAVRGAGAVPIPLGIARDDHKHLQQKITAGFKADALVTAAGVAVGDRDFVREVLRELGVRQLFHEVNIKPGKSVVFGLKDGKPVFSLPGNPVAAMVTFEELVRPALLKMTGHRSVIQPLMSATLQGPLRKRRGKTCFSPVKLEVVDGRYVAHSTVKANQHTGFLTTMIGADAVTVLPTDMLSLAGGEEVLIHAISGALGELSRAHQTQSNLRDRTSEFDTSGNEEFVHQTPGPNT